jgi:hypothetical protein
MKDVKKKKDKSTSEVPNPNDEWPDTTKLEPKGVCVCIVYIGQRKEETRSERVPFLILPLIPTQLSRSSSASNTILSI